MTVQNFSKLFVLFFSLLMATACEDGAPWDIGGNIPVPGTDWCLGVGVGESADEDSKVDWIDVTLNECVPFGGYFTCSGADLDYNGSFGGATCQGYVYDSDPAMVSNDTYSLYYSVTVTNPNDVVEATICYETDMMDEEFCEVQWPTMDGSDRLFSLHVLNPGYTSDGDRIEFTLDVRLNGVKLADPTVWATLNGQNEDVRFSTSNSEYSSNW